VNKKDFNPSAGREKRAPIQGFTKINLRPEEEWNRGVVSGEDCIIVELLWGKFGRMLNGGGDKKVCKDFTPSLGGVTKRKASKHRR